MKRRYFYTAQIFALLALFLYAFSCSDNGTAPEFIIPEQDISFYEHLQPMLEFHCGFESGCHSSLDTDNNLLYVELINKESLMDHRLRDGKKLVDLSLHLDDPHLAPLYLIVLEGYPEISDRMPPYYLNEKPLTDNQIEGIRKWIEEGARD